MYQGEFITLVHYYTGTLLMIMNLNYQIVGVLNATPDSYFDGGKFDQVESAVKRVGEMLADGADIIDIGGESTGPGSQEVSPEEESRRVIPIIKAIKETYPDAKISIDTYKSQVAKEAINSGAVIVNDVTAGRGDPELFSVVALSDALIVLMYSKDDTARTTIKDQKYDDVIATILSFLSERKSAAVDAGIAEDRIIIDPGMGHFVSSDSSYSFKILAELEKFKKLNCPIYVSPSRKSFLADPENLKAEDRLPGTIAASALAVEHGATYIRTHDVLDVRRGCETASRILE